jgi:hypothetical protein
MIIHGVYQLVNRDAQKKLDNAFARTVRIEETAPKIPPVATG